MSDLTADVAHRLAALPDPNSPLPLALRVLIIGSLGLACWALVGFGIVLAMGG